MCVRVCLFVCDGIGEGVGSTLLRCRACVCVCVCDGMSKEVGENEEGMASHLELALRFRVRGGESRQARVWVQEQEHQAFYVKTGRVI